MSVYGPDYHFQEQWLGFERCYLIFLHPAVGVSKSVWGFSIEVGVLYLSDAMLVLAEWLYAQRKGLHAS